MLGGDVVSSHQYWRSPSSDAALALCTVLAVVGLAVVGGHGWASVADRFLGRGTGSVAVEGPAGAIADGTTVTIPDTPENQREYPHHGSQADGIGFRRSDWSPCSAWRAGRSWTRHWDAVAASSPGRTPCCACGVPGGCSGTSWSALWRIHSAVRRATATAPSLKGRTGG